jgi:hypothetical protein
MNFTDIPVFLDRLVKVVNQPLIFMSGYFIKILFKNIKELRYIFFRSHPYISPLSLFF